MTILNLRMRPELVVEQHGRDDRRHWVVKDPVALKYFRLRAEEYSILRMLTGQATLEQIRAQFERTFAPLRLDARTLQAFLFRLHELGLVVSDAPGQGSVLKQRDDAARRSTLLATLANPLAIRLPGVAAQPIVDFLYPRVRWLFGPTALTFFAALVAIAATLTVGQFGVFHSRLPDFRAFFSLETAAWFAVALMGVKVLHELGHALVCRHFGGECQEIGVMLLALTPTMYCDVSDAWRLESRWQRIFVSSAGMLVELVLASTATLLWWFSEPGLLNTVCLQIMFLCSVSTLLFNANPLLRCDGYYILSDALDVPNLWQDSRGVLKRACARAFLGLDLPDDPTIPPRWYLPLLIYAVASMVYCTLLVATILWFCFTLAEPYGLAPLAFGLSAVVLAGMALPTARGIVRSLKQPWRKRKIRRGRAAVSAVVALALLAGLLLVPLPHRIAAPAWLEPQDARPVYVTVPGHLREAVQPGQTVVAGQTLATLDSPEIELQIAELAREVRRLELQLKNLRLMQAEDPSAAPLVPAAEKTLEDAQQRFESAQRDAARLVLKSPAAGVVLAPPLVSAPESTELSLPDWRGTPLDAGNCGCFLQAGTLVCHVGDPQRLEAFVAVEQTSVPFVRVGQRVRIRLEQAPATVLSGRIVELAKTNADDLPAAAAATLDLPQRGAGRGASELAHSYHQARIALDPHSARLALGMTGDAKISADPQPLGQRLLRYLQRTFRLP